MEMSTCKMMRTMSDAYLVHNDIARLETIVGFLTNLVVMETIVASFFIKLVVQIVRFTFFIYSSICSFEET